MSGTHTWELNLHYHRCPKCGYIIESRSDFEYRATEYVKELTCSRCHHEFKETKPIGKHIGPFIGKPTTPEFDWSS